MRETASILADDFNCKVNIVSLYDETIIESENDQVVIFPIGLRS
jgi:translation initiation factor IF-2